MTMPIIALIGRKNVGKSTLFNKLTQKNDSLISPYPGSTRDRQYGFFQCKNFKSILIDTGGIDELHNNKNETIQSSIFYQTNLAIKESDILLYITDKRAHQSTSDNEIIKNLVKTEKKHIFFIINKIDNVKNLINNSLWEYPFYYTKHIMFISAMHGYGIKNLIKQLFLCIAKNKIGHNKNNLLNHIHKKILHSKNNTKKIKSTNNKIICTKLHTELPIIKKTEKNAVTLAIVGCPNSGKSTLINYILKTNRVIADSAPGTTRNSTSIPIIYNKQKYILIDTAGIQKNRNTTEKIYTLKTYQIIKTAQIVLFLNDISMGISNKDLQLLHFILKNSAALIIAINKWDKISKTSQHTIKQSLYNKIHFIHYTKIYFISALYGTGIKKLFQSIHNTHLNSIKNITTTKLISILYAATTKVPPPPFNKSKQIKLKHIHIGKNNPLTFIIHGPHANKLPKHYQQYLKNFFYRTLKITGILLHIYFKNTAKSLLNKK
ncbi:ribosome biogenesis GTPase Der [Candidatus Blochmannia ocreatus (nom. nud.)]|uniref:GTPase Der n=1 Tax=Candidatus Blochmannia ocreatus (nom. nud.) TaxID=251538 RepID=A0ABY4SSP9_9ENTR|nr:ribosome biogenesis GTPase Der [Candidatus Blochmannia ocreatus]URJ25011.1 ribosome biogenesis GTPase Der [Candidatus Blochmannia ocreatus]